MDYNMNSCSSSDNLLDGLFLEQTQNIVITNSTFSSNGRHGVWFGSASQNISILQSTFDSNGYFNSGTGGGNGINCDAKGGAVINNLLIQNNTITNSNNSAIAVTAVTNDQIIGNTINGLGYCVKATGTTNTTISGNKCAGLGFLNKNNNGFVSQNGDTGHGVEILGLSVLLAFLL